MIILVLGEELVKAELEREGERRCWKKWVLDILRVGGASG